ncbi:hypothetical protein FIV42_25365 [Persicimonas caeni]|uniref:Uncharacterized protein n=1 Tax=Persicimonas caeni TaxID=2292766 RepID=A0A4Y6Q0E2_PERCE|nr:DUF6261 family protein [Persicimonas caeni]QDG53950.1 hypothetical protein FIV42_25365 [Persicimonas caeni]QED35171.1 hypothetical protein FRD00_25360 [Persicimonas caeni]
MRIRGFFDLYQMGVGSLLFCLNDIERQLATLSQPNAPLETRVAAAIDKCHHARSLRTKWLSQDRTTTQSRGGAAETDNAIDSTLSGVNYNLGVLVRSPVDSDQRTKARELRQDFFANGVRPFTSIKYEEQHAAVDEMLGRLRGEYAEHVAACGLNVLVDQLETLNSRFGAQLDVRRRDVVEFDDVEAAEDAARDGFARVLATILADYADQPEVMSALLAQVQDQQERIATYVRRRGNTPEVDPGTGEVVEPRSGDDIDEPSPATDPEPVEA